MAINGNAGGLNYRGVNAVNPPNFWLFQRAPTPHDHDNFTIGDIWEYQIMISGNPPSYYTSKIYHLVAQANGVATWIQTTNSGNFTSINYQYFTTPGNFTYIPTTGMAQCLVECVGAGGGQATVDSSVNPISAGAGAGGYCKKLFTSAQIGASQSLTVGSGGTGGVLAGDYGGTGGNTTFGSFLTANGGVGYDPTNPSCSYGGTATGGDINITGGSAGIYLSTTISGQKYIITDVGGSPGGGWGIGGRSAETNPSSGLEAQLPASGYGAGAGGNVYNFHAAGPTVSGIPGAGGLVVVTEYIS